MRKLVNREAVLDQIVELMMQHDIEYTIDQQAVYLYIDDAGVGSVELFANIGGNNWCDDDHITVCCLRECTTDWTDYYTEIDTIAYGLDCSYTHLIESVREWIEAETGDHYEADEIGYCEVYGYIEDHEPLLEKLERVRADMIRNDEESRAWYRDRAIRELDEALEDPEEV